VSRVTEIAERSVYAVQPSHAGRQAILTARLFGSREAVRALSGTLRQALQSFGKKSNREAFPNQDGLELGDIGDVLTFGHLLRSSGPTTPPS